MKSIDVIKYSHSIGERFFGRLKFLFDVKIKNSFRKSHQLANNFIPNRKIESKVFDSRNYVITCYFTKLKDPQHGMVRNTADIKYIAPWYDSVKKLGINGIVVHDGIDEEFIKSYQTDAIQFCRYYPGNFSIFEERWMAYQLLLENNDIKWAFFTDGNDVTVNFDPFQRHDNKNVLYAGRDQANRVGDSKWVIDEMNAYIKVSNYNVDPMIIHQCLYNAGLVGGSREMLLKVLKHINYLTSKSTSDFHKDMSLLNIAIYEVLKPKLNSEFYQKNLTNPNNDFGARDEFLISGYPFNSPFKGFEENSEASFTHK